ncbi:unnamed protein product [Clonostachys rhizophaga]|uniref:Uncharacterized protein n=1 Tax=Clonostachys rhizophaga TaxID=160324 RepID=A0A9N9YNL8_9HYPO|nr:unnamed protein product [Clonostachys rhizophaga]
MRKELETKLRTDFPELYANLQYKQFESLDGWYDIIYRLSANIADIISNHDDMKQNVYTAFQVKEKFGALVFYINRFTDEIYEAIAKASEESLRTCETCGGEGKLLKDSWSWRTICDGCEVERERQWQRIKAGDSAAVPPVDDMN